MTKEEIQELRKQAMNVYHGMEKMATEIEWLTRISSLAKELCEKLDDPAFVMPVAAAEVLLALRTKF